MYVAGTATFDADDETAEWAVGPYAWWPDDRYVPMPQVGNLPVDEAVSQAADIVRALEPWRAVPVAGVAAGFDAGDFEVVYVR